MQKQALWTVLVVGLVLLSLWNLSFMVGQGSATKDLFDPVFDAYELIQERFYRPQEIDRTQLLQGSLRGMLEQLHDPYSNYLSPDEYERFNRALEGEFPGVGIHIGIRNDRLTIVSPIKDGPAERAGARAGDVILLIDDKDTEGMSLDEAVSLLRGPKGTQVTLQVLHRDGTGERLIIERDIIHVPTVETRLMEDGKVGYLRLFTFNENAGQDVKNALVQFAESSVEGIILDLRDNGGGLLNGAIAVASQFVDNGAIVTTTGPGNGAHTYPSEGNLWKNLPVAVLINGASASASEIVAGALQDAAMGVLVGQQSFGKGVVQTLFSLGDGSYLKLTTSEYLTPLGRHVQGEGLTPDLPVADALALADQVSALLAEMKPSLYTKEARALLDALLAQLVAVLEQAQDDAPQAEDAAAALRSQFQDGRPTLLETSEGALSDPLDEFDGLLAQLQDALSQSAIRIALDWLLAHQGQLCPCQAPAIP